jgi:hypothetical protein
VVRPPIIHREQGNKQSWSAGKWLALALIVAGAVSVAAIVIGALGADRGDDLWLEVAKAGVQMVAVGLIGTAVAAAWRYLEQERDRKRQVHEQQLAVFREVVWSYNEVKAIRRTLRSLGLRSFTGALSDVQVSGFREQMQRLNVVQLSFEALAREVPETDIFKPDSSAIAKELSAIEAHLNDVLSVWEHSGSLVAAGTDGKVVSSLERIIRYEHFKKGVIDHRRKIGALIHDHLFGPQSESAKQELTTINNDEDTKLAAEGSKTERAPNTPDAK